jgi:hypothetical protein
MKRRYAERRDNIWRCEVHSNAPANDRLGGVCHRYVVKRAVMMHLIRVGLPSAVMAIPMPLGTQTGHGEEASG